MGMVLLILITFVLTLLMTFRDGTAILSDKCEASRNCSIKINNSTTLLCWVGHREACIVSKTKFKPPVTEPSSSYPSLATIGIYNRPYPETSFSSLNFSFILPQSDGVHSVMAEFNEASGYHDNKPYRKPKCRLFDLSASSQHVLKYISQTTVELSYDCIGIGILPSVFQLHLTSLPMSHQIDYTITWHNHKDTDYHDYYYYDFSRMSTDSVWQDRVVAVATLPHQGRIHVVFQPPKPNIKVPYVQVSLVNKEGVVKRIRVESQITSVAFSDMEPGHYWVTVTPTGGECDLEPNPCSEFESKEFVLEGHISSGVSAGDMSQPSRNQKEMTQTEKSSSTDTQLLILLASLVSVIVLAVIIVLILYHKRRDIRGCQKSKGRPLNTIQIISMSSRHLETKVASLFRSFLSSVLQANVVLFHFDMVSNQLKNSTKHSQTEESETTLLHEKDKNSKLLIVLEFSYQHNRFKSQTSWEVDQSSKSKLLDLFRGWREGKESFVMKDLLSSSKIFLVTFCDSVFEKGFDEVPDNLSSKDEEDFSSDDDVTVIRHNIVSKRLVTNSHLKLSQLHEGQFDKQMDMIKEYVLPGDLYNMYKYLQCQISTEANCLDKDQVFTSRSWKLAYDVFKKAADITSRVECWEERLGDGLSGIETLPETVTECKETRREEFPNVTNFESLAIINNNQTADNRTNKYIGSSDTIQSCTNFESTNSRDSFSNIADAEQDILLHEFEDESVSLPAAHSSSDLTDCKQFQRMLSMKSSKTSGYGSTQGDVYSPVSDSMDTCIELSNVEWEDSDCPGYLIRNGEEQAVGKEKTTSHDYPMNMTQNTVTDIKQGSLFQLSEESNSQYIYSANFVNSIIPPEV